MTLSFPPHSSRAVFAATSQGQSALFLTPGAGPSYSASPCFQVTTSLQRALRALLSMLQLLSLSPGIFSAWFTATAGNVPGVLLHLLSFGFLFSPNSRSHFPAAYKEIHEDGEQPHLPPVLLALGKYDGGEVLGYWEYGGSTCDCNQKLVTRQGGRCAHNPHILVLPRTPGLRTSLPALSTATPDLALTCSGTLDLSSNPRLALKFKSRSLLPPHLAQSILHFSCIKRLGTDSYGSQGDLESQG